PPEIDAGAALHGISSEKSAVIAPLASGSVGNAVLVRLGGEQPPRHVPAVPGAVLNAVPVRNFVRRLAAWMENAVTDALVVQPVFRLLPRPARMSVDDPLLRFRRDRGDIGAVAIHSPSLSARAAKPGDQEAASDADEGAYARADHRVDDRVRLP